MDKKQKELAQTYYHARNIAAEQNPVNGYFPYEINKIAIYNKWINNELLDDELVSYAIIKDPELVYPLGLRELKHGEYIDGYAYLAVLANSDGWSDLGDVPKLVNEYSIQITSFLINSFNLKAPYKEKGLNYLMSLIDDVAIKGIIYNRPKLLDNPVILKNAMERSYPEVFKTITTHRPDLLSNFGKTYEDLDTDHLADIIIKSGKDKEIIVPIIKEKLKKKHNYSDERIESIIKYTFYNNITEIIQEEIKLHELRHVNVPTDLGFSRSDINTDTPLMDNEVIRVYHGFYKLNDALLASMYGLSGKEKARRIYSYEAGNNPKGLFVSVQFDTVKRNFAGSGVIMEFSSKVSDLEAPVWVGGRSYFVQGEYTKSFDGDDEREQQQLANREKHAQSEYPAIANSDRPELAWALYDGPEKQALFTGDLNANMIQAFWVNEVLMKERRTNGPWVRLSRKDFIKKYYNDEHLKTKYAIGNDDKPRYSDQHYNKKNKLFKPAEDFNVDELKKHLADMEYDYDDFVESYIQNWDNHMMYTFFYPKQIEQIKKIYDVTW